MLLQYSDICNRIFSFLFQNPLEYLPEDPLLQGLSQASGSSRKPTASSTSSDSANHSICDFCGRKFYGANQKFLLRRHRNTHSGERKFPCQFCPYRANQSCNLLRHIKFVHGQSNSPSKHGLSEDHELLGGTAFSNVKGQEKQKFSKLERPQPLDSLPNI